MSEKTMTFIDACNAGHAFLSDIGDFVEQWHQSETQLSLGSFLGMEEDEYRLWVERGDSLRFIVAAHRQRIDVASVLSNQDEFGLAARADNPIAAQKLVKWLKFTNRLD